MTDDLTVGTFTPSFLIALARSDGRFAEAGLNVIEEAVTSSPQQFRSLAQGEYDVVFTNPDNIIAYQFLLDNPLKQLLSLRVLAGIDRGLGLGLYRGAHVDPELRTGRLGVDVATSGFAFVAYEILARQGFCLEEMTIESLGATPRRAQALIEGTCDYTILNAGNELRAAARGCALVEPVTAIGPYLGTVLAAMRTDDQEQVAAQNRFRDVLDDIIMSVLSGLRDADVLAAVQELLALDDDDARQHLRAIKDLATGLVPGVGVDSASITTVLALRKRHRPSDELDTVLGALETFIDRDVLV
jgi:ABC-type nitrate/sulfonate/bicarbonate transport system substrate-binding protein